MASLQTQNGSVLTAHAAIAERLAPLGIELHHWPVPTGIRAETLLAQKALDADERDELLGLVEHRFVALQARHGYCARDLIVLHEDVPGRVEALAAFARMHYHEDDEVRYILAGSGFFGFVEPHGDQVLLEVTAGDYINVPARTEHWFVMRDVPRVKAVRYFIDKAGWVAVYTERAVALA